MSSRSRRKSLERLTQPQYGLLRGLTDEHALDAASLQEMVMTAVQDRFGLARGMLQTARLLAAHPEALVRRSAASRAYYGAYHAARATVFAVERRDEDGHDELPRVIDDALKGHHSIGEQLRELKRLRHEADYSPYPGPDPRAEYTDAQFDALIQAAVEQAARLVDTLDTYLQSRR